MALNTYQYPMPSKGATTKLDLWKACIVGVGLNDTVCDNIRDEEYDSYENQVQRYLNDFDVRNRGGEIVWCIHFRKFEFSSRCIMATQTLSPGYWWRFSPGLSLTGIGDNAKIFPQKSRKNNFFSHSDLAENLFSSSPSLAGRYGQYSSPCTW